MSTPSAQASQAASDPYDLLPIPEMVALVLGEAEEDLPEVEHTPREVLDAIAGRHALPANSAPGSVLGLIRQVLLAPSLEEGMSQSSAESVEQMLGKPCAITRVRWLPSDFDEGARCYALLTVAEIEDGTIHNVACSSVQILAVVWRAWVEGKLPLRVLFVQSDRTTRRGYRPFNVRPLE